MYALYMKINFEEKEVENFLKLHLWEAAERWEILQNYWEKVLKCLTELFLMKQREQQAATSIGYFVECCLIK